MDTTVVIPFDSDIDGTWRVDGDDASALGQLLSDIDDLDASGGTNVYQCIVEALEQFPQSIDAISPAIVVLSDGRSYSGSLDSVKSWMEGHPDQQVPVYPIMFGDADKGELEEIAELTSGSVYDGRDGLLDALRASLGNA